jgi:hypothetical protein
MDESVREMVQVIVERLKAFVDGDEDALLELSAVLDSGRYDASVVGEAFEMIVRALEPYAREDFADEAAKERPSVRVPSGPERALLLANPAYAYLFRLHEAGKVSSEQFEEILSRARDMGPSLHDEAQARELAIEVLIRWFDDEHGVAYDPAPTAGVH